MEKKYDENFKIVFQAIRQMLKTDEKPKKRIGFKVKEKQKAYGRLKSKADTAEFSLTPRAQKIWDAIPGQIQMKLLNNVWCVSCRVESGIGGNVSGKVSKGMLVLQGRCTRCGGSVARVIENE